MHNFPFDLVGFDLDGTMLDTSGDLGEALNHALSMAGRPPVARQEVYALVGGGTKVMLQRALERSGGPLPEEETAALTAQLVAYYEAHIAQHTQPYAGALAMMDALAARGVTLALVTNKLEHLARKLLDELGLSGRFATIIGGDTLGAGRAKPKPDLLQLMVERTGAHRPAYVGDTSFDTGAARAAGIPCVVVSFGFCDAPPHELGGNAVIDHFDELIPTLTKLATQTA